MLLPAKVLNFTGEVVELSRQGERGGCYFLVAHIQVRQCLAGAARVYK